MEEINLDVSEQTKNPKNKKGIWIAIIGIVIIVSIIVVASVFAGSSGSSNEKLAVSGTSMSVEYNEYLGYSAKITGVAKNVTSRNFSYASVEFSVYDANGNNLGTALANINNLSSGDTWRFEATLFDFPSTRPATFKLVEIVAW